MRAYILHGAVRCGRGPKYISLRCGAAPALDDGAVWCGPLHCGAVRSRAKLLGPRRALEQMLPGGHFLSVCTAGWSVDILDGQYRAVWPGGSMALSPPGKKGWSGWEGQPPRSLTPAEWSVLPRLPGANRYGGHRWGMCMVPVGLRARRIFHHWGAIRQCFPQGYTNGIT